MHVELRVEARNDLTEAAAFFESQRDGLGDYFIDCLFSDLKPAGNRGGHPRNHIRIASQTLTAFSIRDLLSCCRSFD